MSTPAQEPRLTKDALRIFKKATTRIYYSVHPDKTQTLVKETCGGYVSKRDAEIILKALEADSIDAAKENEGASDVKAGEKIIPLNRSTLGSPDSAKVPDTLADLKAKVEAIHETPSMVLEGANPFDYSEILAIQIVTQHIINEIDAALKPPAVAETSRAAPKEETT